MQVFAISDTIRIDLHGAKWELVDSHGTASVVIWSASGESHTIYGDLADTVGEYGEDDGDVEHMPSAGDFFTALDELIRPKVMTAFWITKSDVIEKAREIKAKRENLSPTMEVARSLRSGTVQI